METLEEYLDFAKDIAKYAGKVMMKYFKQNNGASYKGDKTIVTLADTEINSYLIKRVKESYPSHSVDGEEEQFGKSDYVWVCDPVDGTAMYARHIPVAVFSLALVIKGESKVGVVFDPFTDSLYTAIKGKGAYKSGEKITVNNYILDENIYIGKTALKIILSNLISNAVKYTDVNGVINIGIVNDWLYIENSYGNNKISNMDEIFDVKFDLNKENSNGLGLYIVSNILNNYNIEYKALQDEEFFIFKIKIFS